MKPPGRLLRFKVKLKNGAIVGQDFSWFEWEEDGTIFDVHKLNEDKAQLRAYGYGVIGDKDGKSYGNGALYAKWSDIEVIEEIDVSS
jgi:hypothetical protein